MGTKDVTVLLRIDEELGFDADRSLLKYLVTRALMHGEGERLYEVYNVHGILIDKIEDTPIVDKDNPEIVI